MALPLAFVKRASDESILVIATEQGRYMGRPRNGFHNDYLVPGHVQAARYSALGGNLLPSIGSEFSQHHSCSIYLTASRAFDVVAFANFIAH
jgi:hypothetical protein